MTNSTQDSLSLITDKELQQRSGLTNTGLYFLYTKPLTVLVNNHWVEHKKSQDKKKQH